MAKKHVVTLTGDERTQLHQLISTGRAAAKKLAHARVRRRFVEEGHDSVYVRNGVAGVFMAFGPPAGWRHAGLTTGRTAVDFARFVRELLDGRYRDAVRVVLVMDQLNIHAAGSPCEAFGPAEAERLAAKLEVHHAPKHGSWLNMAEIELGVLSRDLPQRIGDRDAMAAHVAAREHDRNATRVVADWQFATADARVKLRKLYLTVDN